MAASMTIGFRAARNGTSSAVLFVAAPGTVVGVWRRDPGANCHPSPPEIGIFLGVIPHPRQVAVPHSTSLSALLTSMVGFSGEFGGPWRRATTYSPHHHAVPVIGRVLSSA